MPRFIFARHVVLGITGALFIIYVPFMLVFIWTIFGLQERWGVYPKELIELGIKENREIFFKLYRIIYRVVTNSVFIYLVADGRRDMQKVLERRLFKLE